MKKQILIFLFLTLSSFTPILGQKCDELERLIANCPNDTNKVNLLWRWAGCYTGNNPDSVVILCKKGEILARELNFTEGVFKCLARPTASLSRLGRFEEAEKNVKEGQNLARRTKDTFNILRFLDAHATFSIGQRRHQEAIDLCQEGLRISTTTGETYRRPTFYINLGNAYCAMGDAKKSIEASFKGLPFSEKAGDKGELAMIYTTIAINMNNTQLNPEGIAKYARLALDNALATNKNYQAMTAQSILGEYYLTKKKDSIMGVQYIEQALSTARQMNAQQQIAQYSADLGRLYMLNNNHTKSILYLAEAAQIIEANSSAIVNLDTRSMVLRYLGDGYYAKGDYEKAIQIYETFLKSSANVMPVNETWALKHLAEAYAKSNKPDKAYTNYVRYKMLYDSILGAENAVRVKDLESVYLLGKKETELQLSNQARALVDANLKVQMTETQRQRLLAQNLTTSGQLLERNNMLQLLSLQQKDDSLALQELQVNFEKSDKQRQRAEATQLQQVASTKQRWIVGILSGLLALTGIGFYFWRQRQQAISDKKLAESELKALRSQLNPHFLFNSMNAINSYILDNDRLKASEYLAQFAGVMRGILETSRNTTVSLDKELQLLENYIQIEQKRFAKPFDYHIKIDETIDTFSTQVPAMLLQPFVENAIWHGFLHKPTKGHLSIEANRQNGQIVFTIEDDGIGRQKSAEVSNKRPHQQSLGVKINEERLRLINNNVQPDNIHIHDLVNAEGYASGTQIVIFLSEV